MYIFFERGEYIKGLEAVGRSKLKRRRYKKLKLHSSIERFPKKNKKKINTAVTETVKELTLQFFFVFF